MSTKMPHATKEHTSAPPQTAARMRSAEPREHVNRWALSAALLAAVAIFWTLAANAFASR